MNDGAYRREGKGTLTKSEGFGLCSSTTSPTSPTFSQQRPQLSPQLSPKSFADGMKAAGLKYSGTYEWATSQRYWRVEHEVMPADMALSCVQCHASLQEERTCDRCHQDSRAVDFKKIAHKGTDFSYMASKGRDVSPPHRHHGLYRLQGPGLQGRPHHLRWPLQETAHGVQSRSWKRVSRLQARALPLKNRRCFSSAVFLLFSGSPRESGASANDYD